MIYDLLSSFKSSDGHAQLTASQDSATLSRSPQHNDAAASSAYESMETVVPIEGTRVGPQNQRFIAGSTFFNYDACGSLRPDKPAIDLFSPQYVGLAIHVTLVGFVFNFFAYGFGRLLAEYLKANNEQQVNAAKYMLIWPQALVLFIGLLSDSFPMFGYRRKSYMVFGWVLSLVMYIAIIIMDLFGNSGEKLFASAAKDHFDTTGTAAESLFPAAYTVVSLVAATGIQIAWIGAVIASVELAQREVMYSRGRLQATLLALLYLGAMLGKVVLACIISEGVNKDHWVSTVSMGEAASMLAGVSVFAIPFVLFCFDEDKVPPRTSASEPELTVGDRVSRFWKFCHYNIVYRILFFLGLQLFLLGMFNQNVRDAVEEWSRVTPKDSMLIDVGRMFAMLCGALIYRQFLLNANWRKITLWGPIIFLLPNIVATFCSVYDIERNEWFYGALVAIADIPRAWIVLFDLLIATEIAEIGHEGVTVTLGMSFQALGGLAAYTLAAIYPKVFGYEVTMDQVREDSSATRNNVAIAFCIVLVLNIFSFPFNRLLPKQKLDAQQMRVFGGYNRFAGPAVLVLLILFMCFNLAANVAVAL